MAGAAWEPLAVAEPGPTSLTGVLGFASACVLLAKFGILGSIGGGLAELVLDTWNGIAITLLPGAILKY